MNTEKIEKLKKSLSNPKIPADLKPKIEAEIKRLEDLDAKSSQPKEEVKKEEKPVAKTRKPRATKSVAKKTSTRKPSETSKPKRTAMSVAKEIRKEGESWKDAMARASKMMKEKSKTATKDVETELEKLTKLVRSKKELKGQVGRTNLLIDAKRKAKPMGRRVSKDGNVYYENRANRTDRGSYGKYHLAEGGYLTDPTFGNFQNTMFADGGGVDKWIGYDKDHLMNMKNGMIVLRGTDLKDIKPKDIKGFDMLDNRGYAKGGGVRTINGREYSYGRNWTNDHNLTNKGEEHEVRYTRKKLAKGGGIPNNYEGKTPEEVWNMWNEKQRNHFIHDHLTDNNLSYLKSKSQTQKEFISLVTKLNWDSLSTGMRNKISEHINMGQYAKGGGVRTINGREYSYGRNWTNDHNLTNKGEEHEVTYKRKRFELGGNVVTDLAGHTGGSLGTGDPSMLDGFSNTAYTGLVGETGAMSSGEMFAKGGSVNSKFDLSGYKKFRTFNDLEEAKEYVDMDRKKYSRAKESVVIKEGNKFQVWVIPATGIETGNRVYELGGGLPCGSSQSYMITEALGNPAQHFAKGGGIRRINGREYPLGRNWTNDHEHTNKGEEHEVTYKRKGKFLGVFADGGFMDGVYAKGGGVKGDRYDGKTEKIVEELKKLKGGLDNKAPYVYQRDGYIYVSAEEGDNYADYDNYLYIDEKLEDFADKYDTYWDWENAGAIILVPLSDEDEYANGGKMANGGGVDDESPKIYVADLEAYNNGRLSGVWLDLADYNDADELMEAINDFLKTTGGEEYAIHDVEYIPSNMYSEYMGQKDFEELYEMIDLAKENDLPLSVVQEVVSQYDASAVDEFQGRYDDAEDFAQQLVDDTGIESFTDFEYYLYITDTDRRLLSQDMADSYVEDIVDEDGGNRIIEEAGLDVEEYEEAESDRQEEMLDEAREIVYDEYYNTYMEGLSDPYYFLVEEQGMYDAESFANASFVRIDFEKLADALEQDYTFIYDGGSLYVFNIR